MTGIAGMLDAIYPVTRLAGMMGECNHNDDRPAAQYNQGKGKAMQKQSFGPAAAGFATHGSERGLGSSRRRTAWAKASTGRAPSPGTSCPYQGVDSSSSWAASLLTSTIKTNPLSDPGPYARENVVDVQ